MFGKIISISFKFQMSSSLKTAVTVAHPDGYRVQHDITPVIGHFQPTLMCYLTGVQQISMKGITATQLEAVDVVDTLPFLRDLYSLVLQQCPLFHESHIIRMVENNKMLQYLDVTDSTTLSFEAVHYILGSLKDLEYFAFDPKYPQRVDEWKTMLRIFDFKQIEYGGKVTSLLVK